MSANEIRLHNVIDDYLNKQKLNHDFPPHCTNEKPSVAEQISQMKLYHSYPLPCKANG